jgi:hypothetical protein
VSVCRRDGTIAIKKKVPGGPSNGGTYYTLASGSLLPAVGSWQRFRVAAVDRSDGSVAIRLYLGGHLILAGRDMGIGDTAPIDQPGRIGFRGDNTDFEFDDVKVSPR